MSEALVVSVGMSRVMNNVHAHIDGYDCAADSLAITAERHGRSVSIRMKYVTEGRDEESVTALIWLSRHHAAELLAVLDEVLR